MGVPDDANPMNRRLPAEVVTRPSGTAFWETCDSIGGGKWPSRKKQSTKKEEKEDSDSPTVPKNLRHLTNRAASAGIQRAASGSEAGAQRGGFMRAH